MPQWERAALAVSPARDCGTLDMKYRLLLLVRSLIVRDACTRTMHAGPSQRSASVIWPRSKSTSPRLVST